jgi:hypothetical protein
MKGTGMRNEGAGILGRPGTFEFDKPTDTVSGTAATAKPDAAPVTNSSAPPDDGQKQN